MMDGVADPPKPSASRPGYEAAVTQPSPPLSPITYAARPQDIASRIARP